MEKYSIEQQKWIKRQTTVLFFTLIAVVFIGIKQNAINQQQTDINKQLLKIELTPSVSMRYEGGPRGDFFFSNNSNGDILVENFRWEFGSTDLFEETQKVPQGNELRIPELSKSLQELLKGFKETEHRKDFDGNTIQPIILELTLKDEIDTIYTRQFQVKIKIENDQFVGVDDVSLVISQ